MGPTWTGDALERTWRRRGRWGIVGGVDRARALCCFGRRRVGGRRRASSNAREKKGLSVPSASDQAESRSGQVDAQVVAATATVVGLGVAMQEGSLGEGGREGGSGQGAIL